MQREYQKIPLLVNSFGSELNQVWTNIIDNAIDAMSGKGELRVRTYRDDDCVVVEIGDNGPGIPPRSNRTSSSLFSPPREWERELASASTRVAHREETQRYDSGDFEARGHAFSDFSAAGECSRLKSLSQTWPGPASRKSSSCSNSAGFRR